MYYWHLFILIEIGRILKKITIKRHIPSFLILEQFLLSLSQNSTETYVYKDGTISKVFVDEREALNAFGRLISVFTQTGKTDALSIYLTVVNVINISNRSDGQV